MDKDKKNSRQWMKLIGKNETDIIENPVVLGDYSFNAAFLAECVDRIQSEASGPAGKSESELSLELNISRAALKNVLKHMAEEGRGVLVRGTFYSGAGWKEKTVSNFDRNVLAGLREAGKSGLDPLVRKVPGTREALERLTTLGLAVKLGENLFWDCGVLESVCLEVEAAWPSGSRINIAMVRELTGLTRRYIIPLFGIMEDSGRLEREGDDRIIP